MEALFTHLGLQNIASFGYWIIFLLVFGESLAFIGFLVPGSLIVVIAGGLAAQGTYRFGRLFLVTSLAALIGNTVSFELGKEGKGYLKRHPWLWKQVEKGQEFFRRHGGKSVFIGHFLGPIRHVVPVAAGAADMPRWRFHAANLPSAVIWAFTHLAVGYVFGSLWNVALVWSSRFALVFVVAAVLIAALVWLWRWVLRHGKEIGDLLRTLVRAIETTLRRNPAIHAWMERHAGFIRFVHDRFSTRSFFGFPFTLLCAAFLYTVSLLLGIVEDYLSSDTLVQVDQRLANLLFEFRSPALLHAFYLITLSAEAGVVIGTALLLSVLLWRQRQRILVLGFWLTLVLSEATTFVSKLLFHRLRPDELLRAVVENSFSFPSGHATTAAASFGFLAYLLIRTQHSWTVKVSAFFGAALMIILVSFSRLYLGVHFLSDVLAGNLVGLSALLFSISVMEWLFWKRKEKPAFSLSHFWIIAGVQVCAVIAVFFLAPSPWTPPKASKPVPLPTGDVLSLFRTGTLPSYTETLIGSHQEPVNLIVLASSEECLIADLARAQWAEADEVSWRSLRQAAQAVLRNEGYPTAPMTPSFYDARPHDLGFEKQTEQQTVRSRHHARFWQTRYASASGSLFTGTVSLDTGVKWGGLTHTIAPDIDTQRSLIVSDLEKVGVVTGREDVPLVPPSLGRNFTGDAFFTDGKAVFLTLKDCGEKK